MYAGSVFDRDTVENMHSVQIPTILANYTSRNGPLYISHMRAYLVRVKQIRKNEVSMELAVDFVF